MNWESSIHSLALALFLFHLLFSQPRLSDDDDDTSVAQRRLPEYFPTLCCIFFITNIQYQLKFYQVECLVTESWWSLFLQQHYVCLCIFVCVFLLPGWPSRTFGCTSLPQRITGSGRLRVSAWRRGRGLRITAVTGGVRLSVCVNEFMCVRASEYVLKCPFVCESSEVKADLFSQSLLWSPQNCSMFDARHCLCCCAHSPAREMTASLWCLMEEGKKLDRPSEKRD